MAIDQEQWTRLVAKLIADTQGRKVLWKELAKPEPGTIAAVFMPGPTYVAEFNGQAFRFDNKKNAFGTTRTGSDLQLSIANKEGAVLRVVPVSTGLPDLRQAIEDQLSRVDEFVKRYLGN
jgi:hypothetical protein